ncbi:hypothetical protein PILCRDRAFT_11836 [Piloderma croceum F 1598]|uniref:Uncharacterized protein n=1 Tax=Piloderma croceum (strain F 1598) TaxID=765440 RepID=A0A0C3AUZ2_PILCF|nr:hypothetical protein PILCRDRAFT_11836 [Piloderma croceum F 1598]
MAEAKLQDPSDDSELDAIAKAVKEKNCLLQHVHLLDQPEARNQHSLATSSAAGSPSTEIDAEAALMEALTDADEDERLDDGAVEIGSDEEYHG